MGRVVTLRSVAVAIETCRSTRLGSGQLQWTCVSTAFVAKTLPSPRVSTAFAAKTLSLPCVPTAFAAKALPLPWCRQVGRNGRGRRRRPAAAVRAALGGELHPPAHPHAADEEHYFLSSFSPHSTRPSVCRRANHCVSQPLRVCLCAPQLSQSARSMSMAVRRGRCVRLGRVDTLRSVAVAIGTC